MNWPCEKEKSFSLSKSIVSYALEKGLTYRNDGYIILSVPNPTISLNYFFLFGNLHERHELFVKIHFN